MITIATFEVENTPGIFTTSTSTSANSTTNNNNTKQLLSFQLLQLLLPDSIRGADSYIFKRAETKLHGTITIIINVFITNKSKV